MGRTEVPNGRSRHRSRYPTALSFVLIAAVAPGCAARLRIRQPRQAITIINAGAVTDICRVRAHRAGDPSWTELGPIDPIAPGRSRTLRIAHGRWRFRFEACENALVLDSPPIDVAFTRVVFLLCDGPCPEHRAPPGAVIVRHNREDNDWGISQPVYVPTGRRRARFVL